MGNHLSKLGDACFPVVIESDRYSFALFPWGNAKLTEQMLEPRIMTFSLEDMSVLMQEQTYPRCEFYRDHEGEQKVSFDCWREFACQENWDILKPVVTLLRDVKRDDFAYIFDPSMISVCMTTREHFIREVFLETLTYCALKSSVRQCGECMSTSQQSACTWDALGYCERKLHMQHLLRMLDSSKPEFNFYEWLNKGQTSENILDLCKNVAHCCLCDLGDDVNTLESHIHEPPVATLKLMLHKKLDAIAQGKDSDCFVKSLHQQIQAGCFHRNRLRDLLYV